MEELKYESKIYTDSISLYEHIIAFKNAEEGYGDDEFVIKINYENFHHIKIRLLCLFVFITCVK